MVPVRWFRRRPRLLLIQRVTLLDLLAVESPNDYRGVPTRECMCGSDLLLVPVVFNEEREISGYVNTGFCSVCGSMLTVVTDEPNEVESFGGVF